MKNWIRDTRGSCTDPHAILAHCLQQILRHANMDHSQKDTSIPNNNNNNNNKNSYSSPVRLVMGAMLGPIDATLLQGSPSRISPQFRCGSDKQFRATSETERSTKRGKCNIECIEQQQQQLTSVSGHGTILPAGMSSVNGSETTGSLRIYGVIYG